VGAIKTMQLSS